MFAYCPISLHTLLFKLYVVYFAVVREKSRGGLTHFCAEYQIVKSSKDKVLRTLRLNKFNIYINKTKKF